MADNRFRSEIVTKFLVDTCLHDQLNMKKVLALNVAATHVEHDDDKAALIRLLTSGSVAEFYIQPMLSCVGDVDVMFHYNNVLAVPEGTATLTYLPAEFHNIVYVLDIIDSEFPGYVYLAASYILTECTDDGIYNAVQCSRSPRRYLPHVHDAGVRHGPASVIEVPWSIISGSDTTADTVFCVRCLSWPPQAADWPTRPRNYDWPDSATVDRVVNNGCDVVDNTINSC